MWSVERKADIENGLSHLLAKEEHRIQGKLCFCAHSQQPSVFSLFLFVQCIRQAAPRLDAQILRPRARINPQFLEGREYIPGRKL